MATNSTQTKPAPKKGIRVGSRAIAVAVAFLVAFIITAYLILAPQLSFKQMVLVLGFTFSACFLLVYFSYEALVFREINNIYAGLEKFKRKEFKQMSSKFLFRPDPLKRIKDEIYLIAERNQKEIDELKRLQVMRREFLADVSHELKTPIFAAQGFIHTLLDGAMDDERVRDKFLMKAAKSLDGLDTLVQDLITISQLEKGVIQMKKAPFDLNELGQEVFEQLEGKAASKHITLHLLTPPHEVFDVLADRGRIKQVLINLIDNAIKYGLENGNIWLSFQDGKKKTLITVRDDGPGIPKEHLNRIFERFYRIDKSRTRDTSGGGSGLGLAISKHIVEAHQSVIAVSSEVGQGTTLRFKLPTLKE
ncbi:MULTISPECIES: sensor histidine kinase [Rufibacter]|uniref:histidine kinase n=1 Tax=Rufibacter quisquiliarum TaxID=1549639 RepID=A0A839GYB6_9BACT|nr:ATP-binding protein [Rufibacter quisquiliarum]MBA9079696.1 two-component system phosphate regulon sensor histidine kinase PhoR [Rufibacter quisquiliarum]